MKESVTYQAIVEEGRTEGREEGREEGRAEGVQALQDVIVNLGRRRFGPPTEATITKLRGVTELDHLEFLSERLLDVASWEELFEPA